MVTVTILSAQSVAPLDRAYLAGLIDGEGCISIARIAAGSPYANVRHVLRVDIQMSELEAIDHVATLFQRKIMVKQPATNMRKVAYRISWQANFALDLLEAVHPYLILKREQARVAMEFQLRATSARRTGRRLTPEELEVRERYYLELRRLKR